MNWKLEGIYVPVITPFAPGSEELETGMLGNNIDKLNQSEVAGYMPLGSNGEAFMMTEAEAALAAETVKSHAGQDKKVFVGVGKESLRETVKQAKRMEAYGADGVFVLTPHYFPKQMSQASLYDYYIHVADSISLPVILYQAPDYAAGVSIEPDTAGALAKHPNIIGMKGTASWSAGDYAAAAGEQEFAVLSGTFRSLLAGMEDGAAGGVLSCANYMPDLCCLLYTMIQEKNPEAYPLFERMEQLQGKTTAPLGVAGVKAAMNCLGYPCGIPRRPLAYPDPDSVTSMGRILRGEIDELKQKYLPVENGG